MAGIQIWPCEIRDKDEDPQGKEKTGSKYFNVATKII